MSDRRRRGRRASPQRGVDPVRSAAARILAAWIRGQGSAEALVSHGEKGLDTEVGPHAVEARRGLRERVYGCVRLRGRYDHLIEALVRRPPEAPLRAALWIGLHEICELDTPPHAAVSACVELSRALGQAHAAGFVNGVLRRVLREGPESFFPRADRDPLAYARTWLSHPEWLLRRWEERLGEEGMLALCEADNRRPELVLRAAPGAREQNLETIRALGWEAEAGRWAPEAIRMRTRVPVSLVLSQLTPPPLVQDEAAQLVPALLVPERPRLVLDLCAAPGGKALALARSLGRESRVVACDPEAGRLARLVENRARLAVDSVWALVADGRHPPFAGGGYDAVLLDAPCTGTGVLARRHEARWRRRPEDLVELPELQRALLHSAVDLCAPGGMIVYSTCSLEPEENDELVDRVLAEREDLRELGVRDRAPAELVENGRLAIWPHRHGCDGAFAAVLQRREKGN